MDTYAKRFSALDWDQPFQPGIPPPSGTSTAGSRQHGLWTYSGISSGEEAAETNRQVFTVHIQRRWIAAATYIQRRRIFGG